MAAAARAGSSRISQTGPPPWLCVVVWLLARLERLLNQGASKGLLAADGWRDGRTRGQKMGEEETKGRRRRRQVSLWQRSAEMRTWNGRRDRRGRGSRCSLVVRSPPDAQRECGKGSFRQRAANTTTLQTTLTINTGTKTPPHRCASPCHSLHTRPWALPHASCACAAAVHFRCLYLVRDVTTGPPPVYLIHAHLPPPQHPNPHHVVLRLRHQSAA